MRGCVERSPGSRRAVATLIAVALSSSGCVLASLAQPAPAVEGVRELRHRTYHFGPDQDPRRHRANVYLPPGAGPHPVIVFVHGGWWMEGDPNGTYGVYRRLGKRLAARGFVTVVPAYRLAPAHRFPAQVRDVAEAIAWTLERAESFGGDPSAVFVAGHSAGAQLVALAATDPSWLAAAGARTDQLAGVIAISGPYDIPELARSNEVRVEQVFGARTERWPLASPATFLSPTRALPPFLLAVAADDPPVLRRATLGFADALRAAHADLDTLDLPGRNHTTIVLELGADGDPLAAKVERFVALHRPRPSRSGDAEPRAVTSP